jgi:hypothetical protein
VNESGFSSPMFRPLRGLRPAAALLTTFVLGWATSAAAGIPLDSTREDFELPGTQPLSISENIAVPSDCTACHSNYGAPLVEPYRNWQGSMMAQSGRDPLMYAAMAVANQDAPHAGETCIRCHMPKGWLEGRSVPEDATATTADDRHGVQCNICHRLVDPAGNPGAPAEDAAILAALATPVTTAGGAQMVIDPVDRLRGPFDIVADLGSNPHAPSRDTLVSPYHESSALCGTCHDVLNPVFQRNMVGEYELSDNDTNGDPALAFPEQQTYSEWLNSAYASGPVLAPQFAGNGHGVDGDETVSSCQSCHMPRVRGKDASTGLVRTNMPLHEMAGANTFTPTIIPMHPVFGSEVDADILYEGVDRAMRMLRRGATVSAEIEAGALTVRVVNETGHKLPTGYPDGRRMWLHVRAFDAERNVVFESGRYVFEDAELRGYDAVPMDGDYDPYLRVWETRQGMSADVALATDNPAGESFHLALNNVREFDNRIPPRGFTNAAFEAIDAEPVGQAYADGQYWDDVVYPVGSSAVQADVVLYYQTTSKEYVEFLRDENTTNAAGVLLFDLWNAADKGPPVEVARVFVETDADVVQACRKNIDKLQAKYFKTYLGEWSECFANEASSLPCDEEELEESIGAGQTRVYERLGGASDKKCAGASLTPASLGLGSYCPSPCASVVLFDLGDVADCAICLAEAVADTALEAAYGVEPPFIPGTVPFGAAQECQAAFGRASTRLASTWASTLLKCEGANASGKNDPPVDCSLDLSGKIAKAQASAEDRIADCTTYTNIEGCALTPGTNADKYQCVEDAIGDVVPVYPGVAYP